MAYLIRPANAVSSYLKTLSSFSFLIQCCCCYGNSQGSQDNFMHYVILGIPCPHKPGCSQGLLLSGLGAIKDIKDQTWVVYPYDNTSVLSPVLRSACGTGSNSRPHRGTWVTSPNSDTLYCPVYLWNNTQLEGGVWLKDRYIKNYSNRYF